MVEFSQLFYNGIRCTSHHFFFVIGSDTCSMLFKNGRWVKKNWQPNGCMMHDYMPRYYCSFVCS